MGSRWEEGEIERMTRRKTGRVEVWREMGREGDRRDIRREGKKEMKKGLRLTRDEIKRKKGRSWKEGEWRREVEREGQAWW